jgi:hypothetical protein
MFVTESKVPLHVAIANREVKAEPHSLLTIRTVSAMYLVRGNVSVQEVWKSLRTLPVLYADKLQANSACFLPARMGHSTQSLQVCACLFTVRIHSYFFQYRIPCFMSTIILRIQSIKPRRGRKVNLECVKDIHF